MNLTKTLLIIAFSILLQDIQAQIGGKTVFEFLRQAPTPRITALGGYQIAVVDGDVGLAYQNPAVLNPEMDQQISFNHEFYFAGIQQGYVSAAKYIEKYKATFQVGVKHVQYGEFTGANDLGQFTSNFKANEFALVFGASKAIDERISVGANMKAIFSNLESYNASGLALDFGAVYQKPENRTSYAIVISDFGFQYTSYGTEEKQPLPFDIKFGFTKRLEHLPFRFGIVTHHLNTLNLLYDLPDELNSGIFIGEDDPAETPVADAIDNIFRHVSLNGEFLLGANENFKIRLGYNHQRGRELKVGSFRSFAGFNTGFGFRVKQFYLDYGLSVYHLAGSKHHLSISTNIKDFKKRSIL